MQRPHIGFWSIWNRIDHWRATIRAAAINTLSQPTRGLFLGMIIGERGYLEQELQDWFMVTGTVHLLSISGSHLGLVAIVAFWLVRRLVLGLPSALLLSLSRTVTPSKIAILFAWPTVALYALLAGAELATIRSLVMITLAMIAMWLGYERHLGHAMAVALLAILLHDPRALFDISFQLSFLSVLAMVRMIVITTSANADACRGRQSAERPPHEPCAQSAVDERGCDCGDVAPGCVLFQSGSVDGNHHQSDGCPIHRYHLGALGPVCRAMDDYDGGRIFDPWLSNGAIVRIDGSWIAVVCPLPRRGVACGSTINTSARPLLLRVTGDKPPSNPVACPSCKRRADDDVDWLVAESTLDRKRTAIVGVSHFLMSDKAIVLLLSYRMVKSFLSTAEVDMNDLTWGRMWSHRFCGAGNSPY